MILEQIQNISFFRCLNPRGASLITLNCLFIMVCFSIVVFCDVGIMGCSVYIKLMTWINSETLNVDWGFLFDSLTVVMCCIVTFVSLLVQVNSGSRGGTPYSKIFWNAAQAAPQAAPLTKEMASSPEIAVIAVTLLTLCYLLSFLRDPQYNPQTQAPVEQNAQINGQIAEIHEATQVLVASPNSEAVLSEVANVTTSVASVRYHEYFLRLVNLKGAEQLESVERLVTELQGFLDALRSLTVDTVLYNEIIYQLWNIVPHLGYFEGYLKAISFYCIGNILKLVVKGFRSTVTYGAFPQGAESLEIKSLVTDISLLVQNLFQDSSKVGRIRDVTQINNKLVTLSEARVITRNDIASLIDLARSLEKLREDTPEHDRTKMEYAYIRALWHITRIAGLILIRINS